MRPSLGVMPAAVAAEVVAEASEEGAEAVIQEADLAAVEVVDAVVATLVADLAAAEGVEAVDLETSQALLQQVLYIPT